MKEGVVIPAGALPLALDAALALVLADQRQRDPPQPRQVLRRVARPRPASVLPEDDVQHPVQAVPDPPVAADRLGQPLDGRLAAAAVVVLRAAALVPVAALPAD